MPESIIGQSVISRLGNRFLIVEYQLRDRVYLLRSEDEKTHLLMSLAGIKRMFPEFVIAE